VGFAFCCACGSKGSVALSASIENPSVSVGAPSSLATSVSGGFKLNVELGPLAPSPTKVSLSHSNFSLVRATDQSTLVLLKLSANPAPPYPLTPGASVQIALSLGESATTALLVTRDVATSICGAKTVQIAGSVTDDSNGSTTPVVSTPFEVTGCPP
jgi:hypothetical protein